MKSLGLQELPGKASGRSASTRRKWVLLFLLLTLAAAAYPVYRFYFPPETPAAAVPALQSAVARRGELTVYTTGTGTLAAASSLSLGFPESGTLSAVLVQVGEVVEAGQVLARLETSTSPEALAASIASAELSVLNAQAALDKLYANAPTELAAAMQSVTTLTRQVNDSQSKLDAFIPPSGLQDLTTTEALRVSAAVLDEARAAYETVKYLPSWDASRQNALAVLKTAQDDYNAALKRLEYETDLAAALIKLEKANKDVELLKVGPDPAAVAIAEAQLANAKAQLTLNQAKVSELELAAPVAGTVMSIEASPGDKIGSNTVIKIADLSSPLLRINLDETDLGKVAVGQEVNVIFDALPDQTFKGELVSITPSLVTVGNIKTIEAYASLELSDGSSHNLMPVGLNASVDVIQGRTSGAVLVPVEALRQIGPNQYTLFVIENDEPRLRKVEVGLKDTTSAEILSGLEQGERVSTGLVETR
jgi:HlyD family secretion protein